MLQSAKASRTISASQRRRLGDIFDDEHTVHVSAPASASGNLASIRVPAPSPKTSKLPRKPAMRARILASPLPGVRGALVEPLAVICYGYRHDTVAMADRDRQSCRAGVLDGIAGGLTDDRAQGVSGHAAPTRLPSGSASASNVQSSSMPAAARLFGNLDAQIG